MKEVRSVDYRDPAVAEYMRRAYVCVHFHVATERILPIWLLQYFMYDAVHAWLEHCPIEIELFFFNNLSQLGKENFLQCTVLQDCSHAIGQHRLQTQIVDGAEALWSHGKVSESHPPAQKLLNPKTALLNMRSLEQKTVGTVARPFHEVQHKCGIAISIPVVNAASSRADAFENDDVSFMFKGDIQIPFPCFNGTVDAC